MKRSKKKSAMGRREFSNVWHSLNKYWMRRAERSKQKNKLRREVSDF